MIAMRSKPVATPPGVKAHRAAGQRPTAPWAGALAPVLYLVNAGDMEAP